MRPKQKEKKWEIHQMPFPRLTWAGLLIATLGWGFLLSYPLLAPSMVITTTTTTLHDPARFILIFGENAVITGFALALLGALEKALVLLSRLNGTGALRSAPRPSTAAGPAVPHPHPHQAAAPQPQPQLVLQRSSNANEVITRGAMNGRDYVLFRDGSVLVETLLGPRRFPSITEAQEFIGGG
ncbi:MAG: hypothetical protein P8Y36_10445 [Alphaproteobacteria bacterium]